MFAIFPKSETLKNIEDELVASQKLLNDIEHWSAANQYGNMLSIAEQTQCNGILANMKVLELKRTHLLDRRQGWKQRIFWDILIPIIVTIITTFTISKIK